MNFVTEPIPTLKRKEPEPLLEDKEFIEFTDEELLLAFERDMNAHAAIIPTIANPIPVVKKLPTWKEELQRKLDGAETLEELDLLTKEIVKKNKQPKEPKKKLMRVQNFYLRHIQGVSWMKSFLERTKPTAVSRPFVERMLVLENQFKELIEKDELLGTHLEKD